MAKYIELEAAINEVDIQSSFYDAEWGNKRFAPDDVERIIRSIPVADVAPVRHGKWVEKYWSTEDDWGVINWHSLTCSACGHKERMNGLSPNSIYKYDYCPWCGAKMDDDSDV